MATIKDVASMAGVSTATVSRVINQTAWVEPVTRERVEKAMRDLNYRRNAAAIALAKRSGDMLGLLTGNLADPFFARLARGVEDVSRKQQYRLMVCSGGHDEEMEKAGLDFLVNQGCEAIVVHASRLPDKELLRYAAHFPALVVVNRYIAGMANRCIWLEIYPALTTMHYPVEQMARCAAQLAIQLYQGITPPPSSNHFNAELVIRDSVAPYFSR
ncbi:LacI family DNA-binding transcriptional regulator [Salmonella enterica]|nr:LacI family DNA-binding transcriptional regulator [Salmonella enterica]EGB8238990.1 LacI family DNA-binding transcriptional regulator [Salmonella enterica]EGD5246404.1 LacI family DNA-binding transcriptional regulator [Salmonella enterica]